MSLRRLEVLHPPRRRRINDNLQLNQNRDRINITIITIATTLHALRRPNLQNRRRSLRVLHRLRQKNRLLNPQSALHREPEPRRLPQRLRLLPLRIQPAEKESQRRASARTQVRSLRMRREALSKQRSYRRRDDSVVRFAV